MFLHRCQDPQITLNPAIVVVGNIVFNHIHEIISTCEPSAVVSLAFENAPESLHRSIVDTLGYSGHALLHLCLLQLIVKHSVGILETSVAMEQRMCVRIRFNSGIQCVKYKRIIIMPLG